MKRLVTVILLGIIFGGCKKTNDDNSSSSTNFTSYQQYDINAQRLGSMGDASDDYRMEEWPDWVYGLFTPLDTANLDGYNWSEVNIEKLYPNPCGNSQTIRAFATQPVNLKIVIIDQFKRVYLAQSIRMYNGQQEIRLNYTGLGMEANNYYRMFYSFSALGKPHFMRGHIDIYKTN